jgi:hypothetical protein
MRTSVHQTDPKQPYPASIPLERAGLPKAHDAIASGGVDSGKSYNRYYCGSPTLPTSSANRGSERTASRRKSVLRPSTW